MSQTLLEFKSLLTEFHTDSQIVTAVNNVSFTLNKGETIGIVGESGSGKSVTSLSAMRLIPSPPGIIAGGEILFHQKDGTVVDLVSISEKEMRSYRGNEIAMIFQEPMTSLNPVFTCGDQVMEAITLHQNISKSDAKALTIKLFEEVQLPDPERIYNTYPHQISGGQKQRVMIAMAMSCQPSVLVADEPTTALDVTVQKTILELMKKLQLEHDMGIMFITHDLGVIAELADKVVVMYKGNIVEQGNVWDIFTNPQHPYTKGLLACRPPLDKRYTYLPTVSDFMKEDDKGAIISNDISVEEFTKKLIIPQKTRDEKQKALFSQKPLLQIKNLKTYFPIRSGFFGGISDYVKASIAVKVSMLSYMGLMAINSIAAPKFSELYASGKIDELKKIVQQSTKAIFWITLPVVLIFIFFPSMILSLFGEEFKAAIYCLLILSFGKMFSAISGSVGTLLQMSGKEVFFQNVLIASAILNVVLNYILIPIYDIDGAAIASLISNLFWNILMVFYIKKHLGFYTIYLPGLKR